MHAEKRSAVMYRFQAKGQKILKGLHLCAVGFWIGGGTTLCLLSLAKYLGWITGDAIYGADLAAHITDQWVVVILGVGLSLITGLLYGLFTGWGFFRHRWIMLKWLIVFLCIGFGIWLGGREEEMLALSQQLGAESMNSAQYRATLLPYFLGGVWQLCVLGFLVLVSVFKPFGKKKAKSNEILQ